MSDNHIAIKVNFLEIQNAASRKLGDGKKEVLEKLNKALQSIAKRQRYCQYHYDLFKQSNTPVALLKDRIEQISDEELTVRDVYEANSMAFLHNLHAMIDSFPFALNLIYQEIVDFDSKDVGWNKTFLKAYQQFDFFGCLNDLFKSEHFCLLKGYSNHGKHKYPIRIRNTFKELVFENFEFEQNREKKISKKLKVEDFMTNCHDQLIIEFFQLINRVHDDVSKSSL